jgi:hypothetical protein
VTAQSPQLGCGFNLACSGDNNATAQAHVVGGCQPYTYAWSGGGGTNANVSGLGAGTYTVTVTDDRGTTATGVVAITAPTAIGLTFSAITPVCIGQSNGTVNLNVTGGQTCAAYTYAWSNGATTQDLTGVTAGNYTVTVTDTLGCTATSTASVGSAPNPDAGLATDTTKCPGVAVTLQATPGLATYAWSQGGQTSSIQVTAPGTYTVTVTNSGGCTGVDSILVQDFAVNPIVAWNLSVLSTTQPFVTYQWLLNGNVISGATSATFAPTSAGNYSVQVTDVNGCTATSTPLFVDPLAAPDPFALLNGMALYPNPTNGLVNLRTAKPLLRGVDIEIWDMYGQLVKRYHLPQLLDETVIDLNAVAKAVYLVKVKTTVDGKDAATTLRVVKN